MARLQTQFVSSVRAGELAHVHSHKPLGMADAKNVTASGFTCRDPLEGLGPNQRAGELCTAWLGCFTCPNAVIPLTEDALARLLVMKNALLAARSGLPLSRWALVYEPKLIVLERDILSRFPPSMLKAAPRASSAVAQLPRLE